MRILLATSNPHKLEEINAIFDACAAAEHAETARQWVELVSLTEVDPDGRITEPVEDQKTFEGNALLKARAYARASGMMTLADDSGLEVDALGGEPGVISARYAAVDGPRDVVDPANNKLLLERLEGVPVDKRTARFVCVMVLVARPPEDEAAGSDAPVIPLAEVRGTVEGRIILPDEASDPSRPHRGRGSNGFGYDPLFLLPDRGVTSAELPPEEKNRISHRGNAARKMWAWLKERHEGT